MILETRTVRHADGTTQTFEVHGERRRDLYPPQHRPRPSRRKVDGVGDVMERKLFERWGVAKSIGCGCQSTKGKMNRVGPEWCRRHRGSIVSEMMDNLSKLPGWKARLGRQPGVRVWLRWELGRMLDQAIREVEEIRRSKESMSHGANTAAK